MIISGQVVPEEISSTWVMVTPARQLSDAVTKEISTAGTSSIHWKVRSAGQVIVGAISSLMVINWIQSVVLPQASVAL